MRDSPLVRFLESENLKICEWQHGGVATTFQSESDEMEPAVNVQQLAGHKVAFWRREKQYGADQIGFDLRSLDASLLGAYFLIRGINLSPFRDHETGAHRLTQIL